MTSVFRYRCAIFIIVTFFLFNCTSDKNNCLEGVWQLVSTKPLLADGTIDSLAADDWQMMKIITKNHFMFMEQNPDRPKFTKGGTDEELCNAAKEFFGGSGTYTFDGISYTEHIKFFLNPTYLDLKVPFAVDIVNRDLWIQKGTLPVKALGLGDEDYEIYEVWGRVE